MVGFAGAGQAAGHCLQPQCPQSGAAAGTPGRLCLQPVSCMGLHWRKGGRLLSVLGDQGSFYLAAPGEPG